MPAVQLCLLRPSFLSFRTSLPEEDWNILACLCAAGHEDIMPVLGGGVGGGGLPGGPPRHGPAGGGMHVGPGHPFFADR